MVAGFENHAGRTRLDPGAEPLGRVVAGFGNDGSSGWEGCRVGRAVGTYLHGPLLPRNPWFADWLLAQALEVARDGLTHVGEQGHLIAVRSLAADDDRHCQRGAADVREGDREARRPVVAAGDRRRQVHGLAVAALDCDILLTPHPVASNMPKRLLGLAPLSDPNACRGYAASLTQRLDERLAKEAAGKSSAVAEERTAHVASGASAESAW